MDKNGIAGLVKKAGVCGAGGGGFPAHLKLSAGASAVIANGAECEPLLMTDRYLMENRAADIVRGLDLARQASGAVRAYIALKKKYSAAVESIRAAAGETPELNVILLDNYYPAGDEFEVVYSATGKVVPEGGIPLDVGAVVFNVNTLINICAAVDKSVPVTKRWVTVSGEVKEPYIAEVPLGISAGELIDAAGPVSESCVVISGGPMMGVISGRDFRINKLSGGIIVLPRDHPVAVRKSSSLAVKIRRGKSMCDQCFDCTIVCPRHLLGHALEPHRIMRRLFVGPENPNEHITNSYLCCQCGLCNMFACPLDLSPCDLLRESKDVLVREGVPNPHRNAAPEVHPEREYRRVSSERLMQRLDIKKYCRDFLPLKNISASSVKIPLKQHIGSAAVPVAESGQPVNEGDLIAAVPDGSVGADVHASISGKVMSISGGYICLGK